MKECPVCKASCFDDAEVCYGCLHRFGQGDEEEKLPSEKMSDALASSRSLQFSFGSTGFDSAEPKGEPETACEPNVAKECLPVAREARTRPRHAAITPSPSQVLPEKVPSPLDVPLDAVVIPNTERMQEEWVLRVAIPAGCEGVTVRLERP